jgi:hypothetical protein
MGAVYPLQASMLSSNRSSRLASGSRRHYGLFFAPVWRCHRGNRDFVGSDSRQAGQSCLSWKLGQTRMFVEHNQKLQSICLKKPVEKTW